ncbi:endo-1,4-beta-mannosidase [Curtobacterium sp. 320]|uniref:glycoside hydrolase 5 family protein n=1 Tax=Curtobacterium sp. 320 TaxID=2817749 RepID=UPI00285A41D1|nr:cellulase family glycosylhydrolase [Curtobacterium sp. 320]MDR6573610.1 endo-1,4-beta-mannosidase [Curtobacterium sp. 320]
MRTQIERPMRAHFDPPVGVNFWSRGGGPFMWRDFDAALVRTELEVMRRHGVSFTRSFFFWPDFHPEPWSIDETRCAAFEEFLDLHQALGMTTIPTFLIGHMSGQNWDPAWRGGRDLYSDVWMVGRQAWFIREMVARFHDHPAVSGWLISNEMPLYGGGGGLMSPAEHVDGDAIRSWAELMVQAVRAAGGHQPVSLGDGAWGKEVMGADNGFRLSWTAPLVDWIGPHAYHMSDDLLRQHFIPAFNAELCAGYGKPVVLEEFGVSDSFVAEDHAADYYRQILWTTLTAGVTGWIAWNNTDFAAVTQEPYDHRPFELSFGLTDTTGRAKPALEELARFSRTVEERGLAAAHRAPAQVGLVVSGYFTEHQPFWSETENDAIRAALLEAYIASRLADAPPAMVADDAAIPSASLLIVPSAKAITTPGTRALLNAAAAGSTVWVSHCVGETLNQRAWWWPDADEAFGIWKRSRYGVTEPITDDLIEIRFCADFGDIQEGTVLQFPAGGASEARAFLPVEAEAAQVVARDGHGRPAILVHERGLGRTVLSTYPLELLCARTPHVDHRPLAQLYRALAVVAGVSAHVSTDDLDSFADTLLTDDGGVHTVVVNTAGSDSDTIVRHADGDTAAVHLPAFAAVVLDRHDDLDPDRARTSMTGVAADA